MTKAYKVLAIAPGYATALLEAEARLMDNSRAESERPESRILQMADNVGVIEVKGKLVNNDSPWNHFFGMLSYNQIREAVIEAVELGAASILFDVDSPGGHVSGMKGLSTFIESIDIKTVAHSSSTMASAAYFFGASTNYVFSDDMAEVGSIGVVMTAVEYTEAMKKQGAKAEVFRSGKHKQAGNPYEKLTAENKAYIQGQVDTYAGKFFSFVSEKRGLSMQALEASEITTGRTYIGEEALQAGLVDDMKTFDEALMFAYGLAEKYLDNNDNTSNYYGNQSQFNSTSDAGGNMKKLFSPQAVAALVKPEVEDPQVPEGDAIVEGAEEPNVTPEANASEGDGNEAKVETKDLEALEALEAEMGEKVEAVKAEAAEVLETAKAEFEGKLEAAEGLTEKFKAILAEQTAVMRSAMALPAVDYSAVSAEDVLSAFGTTAEAFNKVMPAGGVVPDPEVKEEAETVNTTRAEAKDFDALGF